MSPHRETLVAFYTWQNPDQISNIDKILEAYNGREPALLQELGRNFPLCVGWSDARGCLKHYLTRERPDIEKDVDTILQTWHSENKGSMEEEDARLAGGHFTLMYAAFDVRYSTTHFSQWLRLVDLYHTYDSAKAPQLKHDIPAFLDACKGAESAATDEVQLQYDNFTAEMKMWITRFYKRHKPEKLDKIDTIMESHKGSLSSIILRVTLHRLYVAEKYLTAATWSSSHPGHWNIRFALLEYFQEKDPEKLVILDTILEAYPPADLVRHLYSTYEPEYLKHLAAKKLEPAKVLFPPWRNPDYPQEMPQGMPRFQGTIPAEGTQQPDLLTLDERLYPIEKEEDKEKLEAENKAAEERIALEKKAAEEEEKIEAEKKAAEEKLAMEKKEMNEKIDAENKAAEERIAMEKKAAEEEEKIEAENRIAMERKAAEEKERIEQEEKEDEESRKRAEEDEKLRKELETEEHEKREAVHQTENEVWGEIQESAKVDAADRTRRQSFFTPSEQLNSVASQLLQPNAAPSATRRMTMISTISSMLADDAFSVLSDHQACTAMPGGDVPKILSVESPALNGPGGTYNLVEGRLVRNMPCWKQEGNTKVIYLGHRDRWMIGKEEVMEQSKGWAMSQEIHNGRYPNEMGIWQNRGKGWVVDPSFKVREFKENVSNKPLDQVQVAQVPHICTRCSVLQTELKKETEEREKLWRSLENEKDSVAELEAQMKICQQKADAASRLEEELAQKVTNIRALERKLDDERSKVREMNDQLAYLKNRENTRDDVGNSLRESLLELTEKAMSQSQRQISRMREAMNQVAALSVEETDGRVASMLGTMLVNIEKDALRANKDVCDGGLDKEIYNVRTQLNVHQQQHGIPPTVAIPEVSVDVILKQKVEELQEELNQVPLRMGETHVFVGEQQRKSVEKDKLIHQLRMRISELATTPNSTINSLQTQLDAAHAAMGLPNNSTSPSSHHSKKSVKPTAPPLLLYPNI